MPALFCMTHRNPSMHDQTVQRVLTIGEIARRTKAGIYQVEYVIRSRQLAPVAWAGNARVFSESDAELIASELRRIAEERSHRHV